MNSFPNVVNAAKEMIAFHLEDVAEPFDRFRQINEPSALVLLALHDFCNNVLGLQPETVKQIFGEKGIQFIDSVMAENPNDFFLDFSSLEKQVTVFDGGKNAKQK